MSLVNNKIPAQLYCLVDYRKFINNLQEDLIDQVGSDYTSCWLYALYIHTILDLPINNGECVYNETINDLNNFTLDTNGMYSFFTCCNSEFHHFILHIIDDKLTLLSTYGGQPNIIYKEFNTNEWVSSLKDLYLTTTDSRKSQIAKYKKLYGIKKVNDDFNLTEYQFKYTFIPSGH